MFKDEKCHRGKLSNDRVTVLLACNMDGCQTLKPFTIGKSEKPRPYKKIVDYDRVEWLTSVNSDMKNQKRKIFLFWTTAPCNSPPLDHVKLIFSSQHDIKIATVRPGHNSKC
ncbi:hypothetical protein LAZ67_3004417 [Cordylochernes scorpioides]|uniref:DDE-1 domain-containing protein n=1 Tax=Cordylochernes scorpioides TaxID=51811 RepID=A0ABY6KAD6_9ARAC|nr:hypothetical protein LAZ67_3004417 [Cordylochernes scorpioides]